MHKAGVYVVTVVLLLLIISYPVGANDYKLTTDDQLYISVWGHPDLEQETVIGPTGKISFPLIGEITAEGLTVHQLTKLISNKLSRYVKLEESQVNVVLKKYQKFKVMVLGEVKEPGTYPIKTNKRVLDLISLAGGTTKTANLSETRLTRGNKSLPINLRLLLTGTNIKHNYLLQDGDVLYIPEDTIEVTIFGEVNHPGRYKLEEGLQLSDVIAQAGGVTKAASPQVKYISQGQAKQIDLTKLLEGKVGQNPTLHDGDTINIPRSNYDPGKKSFWKDIFFFVGGMNEVKDLFN